uniref:Uncharacterized protein n=1 Tax=Anguilla anguilla TaxID=7936 RepID=A0A0E9VQL5_ANGAN
MCKMGMPLKRYYVPIIVLNAHLKGHWNHIKYCKTAPSCGT